jgi:hypothetical protein
MNSDANPNQIECPHCGSSNIVLPSGRSSWTCSVCDRHVGDLDGDRQADPSGKEILDEIDMARLHRQLDETRREHQSFIYRGNPRVPRILRFYGTLFLGGAIVGLISLVRSIPAGISMSGLVTMISYAIAYGAIGYALKEGKWWGALGGMAVVAMMGFQALAIGPLGVVACVVIAVPLWFSVLRSWRVFR